MGATLLSLESSCGAQSPFVTSHFCYRAALQRKQTTKVHKRPPQKNAASSNERFALDTKGSAGEVKLCREGRGGGRCVIKCVCV